MECDKCIEINYFMLVEMGSAICRHVSTRKKTSTWRAIM